MNKMGEKGVEVVKDYLSAQGYRCNDVQKKVTSKGCDIEASKNGKPYRIEVKTTQKDEGIPDCYHTEFSKLNKFLPDFLYVVRLDDNFKLKRVEILTRREVNKYTHQRTERVRISSKLKTALKKRRVGKLADIKLSE